MRRIILTLGICLIGFFFVQNLMAQGTVQGCLTSEKRVYAGTSGQIFYPSNNIYTDLSPDYCSWNPSSTSTTCYICSTGVNNGNGSCQGNSARIAGVQGIFTMMPCPIDDYLFLLILPLSGISYNAMRKKSVSTSYYTVN